MIIWLVFFLSFVIISVTEKLEEESIKQKSFQNINVQLEQFSKKKKKSEGLTRKQEYTCSCYISLFSSVFSFFFSENSAFSTNSLFIFFQLLKKTLKVSMRLLFRVRADVFAKLGICVGVYILLLQFD